MVPIMNLIYKFTLRKSVSVSETAIVSISLAGWLQYILRSPLVDLDSSQLLDGNLFATVSPYSMGYIDFGVALPLVIGAFIGSGFGVKMHDKINTRIIKIIFGVLLLLVCRPVWQSSLPTADKAQTGHWQDIGPVRVLALSPCLIASRTRTETYCAIRCIHTSDKQRGYAIQALIAPGKPGSAASRIPAKTEWSYSHRS